MEDMIVAAASRPQVARLNPSGTYTIELECGCLLVLRELGCSSCPEHGEYDAIRLKTDVFSLAKKALDGQIS